MTNLHELTAAVISDLDLDDLDELIVFDHGSDDPATIEWLREIERMPKVTVDRRAAIPEESLYRSWNDTIRHAIDQFAGDRVNVVLLNNDVRLPRGFLDVLTTALRSRDQNLMITYPDVSAKLKRGIPASTELIRTTGLAGDGGMTGWAFALKAEVFRGEMPFIDERLKLYSGDRDLIHNVEARGYYAARVIGLPCEHRLGTTRRTRPELKDQERRDVSLWWGEHRSAPSETAPDADPYL